MIGPDGRIDVQRAIRHVNAQPNGVVGIQNEHGEVVLILAKPDHGVIEANQHALPSPPNQGYKMTRKQRKARAKTRAAQRQLDSGRTRRGRV